LEQDFGFDFVKFCLTLIVVSNNGLLENEIIALLYKYEMNGKNLFSSSFSQLYTTIKFFFSGAGGGVLQFFHQQLRYAIQKHYNLIDATNNYTEYALQLRQLVIDIFWDQVDPIGNFSLNGKNQRSWRELELYLENLRKNESWYKFTHKSVRNSIPLVIRFMEIQYLTPEDKFEIENEIKILSTLQHPNIHNLLGSTINNNYWIIAEYPNSNNLFHIILKNQQPEWSIKMKIINDIALAMNYLHELKPPIVHLDLTCRNIMIWNFDSKNNVIAKIAGFYQSAYLTKPTLTIRLLNEQPRWQSPECLQRQPFSSAADVYCFGILLLEIATWQIVFSDWKIFNIEIYKDIIVGKRPNIPENCPQSIAQLIIQCWDHDPQKRPNFKEIVKSLANLQI